MDIFRDASWTFVGVVLAIAALLVTIYGIKKQIAKKSLIYTVGDQYPLYLLYDEKNHTRVKVLFDEIEVKKPITIDLRLKNLGNMPINEADFAGPIKILFSSPVRIVSSQIIDVKPGNLPVIESPIGPGSEYGIQLAPLLLNPGDSISIRFLYEDDGTIPELSVSARISGISEVKRILHSEIGRDHVLPDLLFLAVDYAGVGSLVGLGVAGTLIAKSEWFGRFLYFCQLLFRFLYRRLFE
ncbi:MAG: hypothetical protein JWP38_2463 [Herbaspirillum sp.]|nr:hypothetical protein [Herbaspirillum sp.]